MWFAYGGYMQLREKSGRIVQADYEAYNERDFQEGIRKKPWAIQHARTFCRWLYNFVPLHTLKDEFGDWLQVSTDIAMYLPMLEIAGWQHSRFMGGKQIYVYRVGASQFSQQRIQLQRKVAAQIAQAPSFSPLGYSGRS